MSRLYIKGIGVHGRPHHRAAFSLCLTRFPKGVFWGTVHLAVSLFIVCLLHQWVGEVSLHQREAPLCLICGNVFGQKGQIFSVRLRTIGAYYGSLLVMPLWAEFF